MNLKSKGNVYQTRAGTVDKVPEAAAGEYRAARDADRMAMGQRIREARAQKRWTQQQAADLLGCSRRRFNRVEQGLAELTNSEIKLLAKALSTDDVWLKMGVRR